MRKVEVETWVTENKPIGKWLERMAVGTRERYRRIAYAYFVEWLPSHGGEFAGLTPAEMLDLQEKAVGRDRYKQVDLLQTWIRETPARYKTKKVTYHIIRSFYAHNRVPLPQDKGYNQRIKGDNTREPVIGALSMEDLKKVILSSNETYQAVFLCMFQSSMGGKEFEHFNFHGWKQIEEPLKRDAPRIRIDLPGRKHARMERPFYSFIGRDSIDALKRYLKFRGPIKNGEPIFLNMRGTPVTKAALEKYFRKHIKKTGVVKPKTPACPKCGGETRRRLTDKETGRRTYYVCGECGAENYPTPELIRELRAIRYGCDPHEMRDLFRSEWQKSQADPIVAEFMMGHDIDPNKYNKFFNDVAWVESQYRLAEPWLNIISDNPRVVGVDRVKQLQETVERLKAERETEQQSLKEEIAELRAIVEKLLKEKG